MRKNVDERNYNFCDNNLQKSTKQHVDKEPTLGWPSPDFLAPYRKQNNLR